MRKPKSVSRYYFIIFILNNNLVFSVFIQKLTGMCDIDNLKHNYYYYRHFSKFQNLLYYDLRVLKPAITEKKKFPVIFR